MTSQNSLPAMKCTIIECGMPIKNMSATNKRELTKKMEPMGPKKKDKIVNGISLITSHFLTCLEMKTFLGQIFCDLMVVEMSKMNLLRNKISRLLKPKMIRFCSKIRRVRIVQFVKKFNEKIMKYTKYSNRMSSCPMNNAYSLDIIITRTAAMRKP
mmetsp:Transcript_11562/g.18612  ORF Transcript_11562/g.18612 Transcript_11562/m.18612 type:complete len:156 (-) Transcript_11562:109-576(-)